jgi:hypothetical protein
MQANEVCNIFKRVIRLPKQYSDDRIFYPHDNIYPKTPHYYYSKSVKLNENMKDHESLYQYQEEDKLLLAVYWLQEERIANILQNDNNYNIFVHQKNYDLNPIEILCRDGCGYFYYFECNKDKYLRIAEQLAKFNSAWVTSKCFLFSHYNQLDDMTNLLLGYSENNENICYICLNSEPVFEFLNNVCNCSTL